MSNGIQGKVVVITGASSGLGESTARHLGNLGATVILGARRKDRLDAIVKDIEAKGGKALAVTADVTKRSDVESLVKKGVLYGIAAALPQMKKQQSGHFINIASVFGIKVFAPGGTVYCATKAAVRSLTEGLRIEVHGDKIRTTIIDPGAVESELKESTSDQESSKAVQQLYNAWAISAESIARAIAYAIEQPADVDVNEIVVRPVAQDF